MKINNRRPSQIPVVGSDNRTNNFNMLSFEGITNSDNDLTVSPFTFSDANNMYINSEDLLCSRPSIKSTKYLNKDLVVLENVENIWVVDDLLIYHQGEYLKFIKNNIPSDVSIKVGKTISILESVENYILIYPANIYIDVSLKDEKGVLLYKNGPISDICYIPTTELRSGNEISYPEKPNRLSPYSKHSIIYDKSVYTDLSELYGKNIEVLIGDKTYHIENYRESDVNTLQDVLTVSDFRYVKYSNVGSAIGYKNAIIYYAPDGRNFKPLPTVPGNIVEKTESDGETNVTTYPKYTGEAFISEVGDACFVISIDHIYAISLLETDWDAINNLPKKRWSDWTMLNWSDKWTMLQSDANNDVTATEAGMDTGTSLNLNFINMTKADEPRPYYYSRNYARVINENTFVIMMYAGTLPNGTVKDEAGNINAVMSPTIFVYNRQLDSSKVMIYQMCNIYNQLYYSNDKDIYNTVAEMTGGDFDLLDNTMMICLSYKYATAFDTTNKSATINNDLLCFTVTVDTNGTYKYNYGYKYNTIPLHKLNLNAYKPMIADLKINFASFHPKTASSQYDVLMADINHCYTDCTQTSDDVIIISKYSMQQKYSYGSSSNVTPGMEITKKGDVKFNGIHTTNILISRSSLRIATDKGLLVSNNDLSSYEYIPYRVSSEMKPIYIDEDSFISQKIDVLDIPLILTKDDNNENIISLGLSDEHKSILNKSIYNIQTNIGFALVDDDNVDQLVIPGFTAAFSDKDLNKYIDPTPTSRLDYLEKYVAICNISAYSNLLYTTDNTISTLSIIVRDEFYKEPEITCSAKLIDVYFGSDRNLYIGKILYDKDEQLKLYFSEGLWEEFEESIFQLQILSRNSLGVYCRDSIWIVYSDDKGIYYKSKSKISSSCRNGDSVVLSMDGKGSLYPCHRGIAYIEHQSLVSVEEQQLSFITDDIKNYMIEWIKDKPIKMFNDEFWLYVYSTSSNVLWLMDLRKNTWWRWTTPVPITNIFMYMDELYFVINKTICKLTSEGDYHDIISYDQNGWKKIVIPWFFESQRLYLNDMNRYKHIHSITLNNTVDNDDIQSYCSRLKCYIYRTLMSSTPENVLDYKVSGIRSYVKKLNIFKCNFFKYRLSSDTSSELDEENFMQKQIKIEGISIKYGLRERIR